VECPLCKQHYEPVENTQLSDKDKYLKHWGYMLDSPEAEEAWQLKLNMTKQEAPMVHSDIAGYISQVDGSWIDSKSKHRDHLKRHRMIEVGNDVPMQQKKVQAPSSEERKRAIGEIVYSKLKY
jgi:adenine-specific DNA methylase